MTFQLKVLMGAVAALPMALWAAGEAAPAETNVVASAGTNAVAAAQAPVDPKFERYRTILDRMPFGPEPVNFNPDDPGGTGGGGPGGAAGGPGAAAEAEQTVDQQQIISSVRVSALNVTPSGKIAVGFTDNSKQPAANYYLKVGETRDDWTVKEADAAELTVVLEKGGVSATLKLGEGSDAKGGKKGAPVVRGTAGRGLMAARRVTPTEAASEQPPAEAGGSPLARLRANQARTAAARREELRRKEEAAAQAKAEREAERAQVQEEREQQRQALLQIQEELKQQREARQREQDEKKPEEGGGAPME